MLGSLSQWSELNDRQRESLLERPALADHASIRADTKAIIAAVRDRGDQAVRDLTLQHDHAEIHQSSVSAAEIAAAADEFTGDELNAIDTAIANVRAFHEQQTSAPISVETMPGVLCERVARPIDAVGLYVPAGTAPLPSAAIMLAVPAIIAKCPRIVLCTPPQADGRVNPAVLVAATRAGVREIHAVGGAQAIAAMAYGTESIPNVLKIFGPGNAWVTCAKIMVSSDPAGAAIDIPAGPSEVLVIADESASPTFVAADLLSQAEHGNDSQVLLVTTSSTLAMQVGKEVEAQLRMTPRADIAAAALAHSRMIIVGDIDGAVEVSNRYAPEHLILQIRDPRSVLPSIRNAGSVFVGPWTPESVGDYCSGTNHVLPTYGLAAMYSGLGVEQFVRQMTVQEVSRAGLEALAPTVVSLARLEGLDAHAAAVTRRLATPS